MFEWYDEVEIGNNTIAVGVVAEWAEFEEELHPGYWDISVFERSTGEELTRLVSRQQIRRLERKADQLAEASWDDAAIDPVWDDAAIDLAIDVFCN